jgi:hypothetical protein
LLECGRLIRELVFFYKQQDSEKLDDLVNLVRRRIQQELSGTNNISLQSSLELFIWVVQLKKLLHLLLLRLPSIQPSSLLLSYVQLLLLGTQPNLFSLPNTESQSQEKLKKAEDSITEYIVVKGMFRSLSVQLCRLVSQLLCRCD